MFILGGSGANGAKPYLPEIVNPLLETWRWKQFSRLEGKGVRCISESPDGRVWFGGDSTLMEYDGYRWIDHDQENGLLGHPVSNLHTDNKGGIYAATPLGIFSLQGDTWSALFAPEPSLGFNFFQIRSLADGSLLVCSNQGLLRIKKGQPIQFFTLNSIRETLHSRLKGFQWVLLPEETGRQGRFTEVSDALQDPSGTIWVAITRSDEEGAILKFSLDQVQNGALKDYQLWVSGGGLTFGETQRLLRSRRGDIWVINTSYKKGINVYDGKKWSYIPLSPPFGGDEYMNSIAETHNGTIWIGGLGRLYSFQNGKWSMYKAPEYRIPANKLILRPSQGDKLWVAGMNSKVFLLDYSTTRWLTYNNLNFQCESKSGEKWFLDVSGKAILQKGVSWTAYAPSDGLMDAPVRLLSTSKGQIWASGSHKGVAATSFFEKGRWHTITHPRLSWGIDYRAIFEAADGSLWFGASVDIDPEKGHQAGILHLTNPLDSNKRFIHLKYQEKGLNQSNAYGIGQTNDGRIWLGGGSLYAFNGQSWSMAEPDQLHEFVNVVNSTHGLLLVGSRSYGVFLFDGKTWQHYDTQSGLTSNTIISIAAQSKDRIYAATENDISCFDGSNWTNHVFPEPLNMDFEGGMILFSSDGAIWITKSLREWKRRAFSYSRASQDAFLHFVSYRYLPDDKGPETQIVAYSEEVTSPGNTLISWKGEDFFSETPAERLTFSYRINGGEWSPFSAPTYHTFLGLSSGQYTLEVRARDLDLNIDPTPAVIQFRVLPPVWKQTWFIGLLLAFLLTLGVFEYRVLKRNRQLARLNESLIVVNTALDHKGQQIEAQNRAILEQQNQILDQKRQLEISNAGLEEQNQQIQSQRDQLEVMVNKVETLSRAKVNFFTNISHELRTPLTLILGPVEQLLHSKAVIATEGRKRLYEIIDRNAFRLLNLINQLLEVRRIESNALELNLVRGHISVFIGQISGLFDLLAQEKKIDLVFQSHCPELEIGFDPDKMEKILVNLLSNSFKHTSPGERISVLLSESVKAGAHGILLEVEDTGAGIAPEDLTHIFERYFSAQPNLMNSGIGLSYIKDLVELHQGSIEAQSKPGIGTRFSIWLPNLDKGTPLPTLEQAYGKELQVTQMELHSLLTYGRETDGDPAGESDKEECPKVLIVEDNEDMLLFLEGVISAKYAVVKARNGVEGLEAAKHHAIDLILSDIIMPEMDGLAFCERIKSDILTSHIPVILLTAKTQEEHRMEGFHTGADDYMTKPFNPELLLVRIANLLEQRQKLRNKYVRELLLRPRDIQVTSPDEALLRQLTDIMETHIADADFNVNKMCEMVHLSHMHFIRKVKQLTGKKPIDLLKSFRLQRAKELLKQNKLNVAEIAYMVGYDLPNSFSRAFKKEFGLTPSEYLESIDQLPHESRIWAEKHP
ncbi:MAG: response regulator [Haliscomenobacter sp.]|nr:response regulator [Haliscomenobacter sp.]